MGIVQRLEFLGSEVARLYNELSKLAQGDVARESRIQHLNNLKISFMECKREFQDSVEELRLPSLTADRKGTFVDEVQEAMELFESLYCHMKRKVDKDIKIGIALLSGSLKEGSALTGIDMGNAVKLQQRMNSESSKQVGQTNQLHSATMQSHGLVRKFKYLLNDLNVKIEKKNISMNSLRERFRITESVFVEYLGEFPDDDLTDWFYDLRGRYLEIPGIEKDQYSVEASQQFTSEKDAKLVNPSGMNKELWEGNSLRYGVQYAKGQILQKIHVCQSVR